ncbi:MAG: hypothetical protein JWO36_6189 [Myxococcales bacterium]|nr:hypothetical protein [Myxococcales bacterium]
MKSVTRGAKLAILSKLQTVTVLLGLVAGCVFKAGHSSGDPSTTPTVTSSSPIDGATGVSLSGSISATFSEAMDPTTLTISSFTLTSGATAIPVVGTVTYGDGTVVLTPTAYLASDSTFTATITAEATSALGVALATEHRWSFTGNAGPAGIPVDLGTAANYVILAKSGISGITATVTGNLGVSPAAATYITGFSLIADASNMFSTSAQITGRVYAASYVAPTPAILTTAVSDMELAFSAAAARTADVSELGSGDISGMTLAPGVYRWSTGLTISSNVTLAGGPTAVWIFQVAQDLTMNANARIVLAGGALPKNVFWQVSGGPLTLAAMAHLEGIVLTSTAVTFAAGASINGRLLAQTAANVNGSTVVEPSL